jgi:hypothetical protein
LGGQVGFSGGGGWKVFWGGRGGVEGGGVWAWVLVCVCGGGGDAGEDGRKGA